MLCLRKLIFKNSSIPSISASPHVDHILETDSSELRLKNVMITKFLLRFPNEIILKLLAFVPDLFLVLFFSLNVPKIRFLEERIFVPGTKVVYVEWFPTLDSNMLCFRSFEKLVVSKKISIRFLDIFQFGCRQLSRDNWQVPLFLFPFIVRYINKEKTKAEIDDWNRVPMLNESQEDFLLNRYSGIIKEYKKRIPGFVRWQDDAQQRFFKRIKNTNFQFTIKSMEQNSCFTNYQFTRLHLKTYYVYRGSRCLINLFNFKKLTKLTIDFLYPGYYIPNWKKIVPKLTALKFFTLNIGKLRSNDIGLVLQIKTLVEFHVKTYRNWRQPLWQQSIDNRLAKPSSRDPPKISMKLIDYP